LHRLRYIDIVYNFKAHLRGTGSRSIVVYEEF